MVRGTNVQWELNEKKIFGKRQVPGAEAEVLVSFKGFAEKHWIPISGFSDTLNALADGFYTAGVEATMDSMVGYLNPKVQGIIDEYLRTHPGVKREQITPTSHLLTRDPAQLTLLERKNGRRKILRLFKKLGGRDIQAKRNSPP